MIDVLIVDDHPIVIAGLKQVFSVTTDIKTTGEANNGQQALEKIEQHHYDVVLLDISMPGENGIELLKIIKAEKPNLPVIILSTHPEDQYAVRALKAGASGYVTKVANPAVLIDAIRKAATGHKYISPTLAENLANYIEVDAPHPLHENLSNREFQVMGMIASGKSINAIADELCISEKTVRTYKARIMEKLNLHNDAQLTRYAIKNNLID